MDDQVLFTSRMRIEYCKKTRWLGLSFNLITSILYFICPQPTRWTWRRDKNPVGNLESVDQGGCHCVWFLTLEFLFWVRRRQEWVLKTWEGSVQLDSVPSTRHIWAHLPFGDTAERLVSSWSIVPVAQVCIYVIAIGGDKGYLYFTITVDDRLTSNLVKSTNSTKCHSRRWASTNERERDYETTLSFMGLLGGCF